MEPADTLDMVTGEEIIEDVWVWYLSIYEDMVLVTGLVGTGWHRRSCDSATCISDHLP